MKFSKKIKPITYLKNHTADVMKEVILDAAPVIITHNGEAKLVIQDIRTYEEQKEALTLLKMLAQSTESMKKGKYKSLKEGFRFIRRKVRMENEKV